MQCEKCNSKNLQAISEYKELPEKENYALFGFLQLLATATIFLGVFAITANIGNGAPTVTDALFNSFMLGLGIFFIIQGIGLFIAIGLIRTFQPFKHETKTRIVCMECGHTWILETEEKGKTANVPGDTNNQ